MAIEQGQFFTVNRWLRHFDRSYIGDCLEALAVDGDFVRVRRHHHAHTTDDFTLCLREVEIHVLSDEFVSAVRA